MYSSLTLFDAQTNTFETRHATEDTDIHTIQEIIKEKYNMVADQMTMVKRQGLRDQRVQKKIYSLRSRFKARPKVYS